MRGRLSAWVLLLLVIGPAWIWINRVPQGLAASAGGLPPAPAVGHPAPDFTLRTAAGEPLTLSQLRGTPVVLNFWATWCPPCRSELPELDAASKKYAGQIAIAGVNQAEPPEAVQSFAREMDLTFPIPLDTQSQVSRDYGVRSLPTTFFIDRQGIIRQIQIGPVTEATLTQLLRSIYP